MRARAPVRFTSLDVCSSSPGLFIVLILFRSRSQSNIHIYERQESKKGRPCRRARCGLANICAGTCTPFIDLLTRRHPTVPFLSTLCSQYFPFFFFFLPIGDIVSISKESAALSHNRLKRRFPKKLRRAANFVIMQNKGGARMCLTSSQIVSRHRVCRDIYQPWIINHLVFFFFNLFLYKNS